MNFRQLSQLHIKFIKQNAQEDLYFTGRSIGQFLSKHRNITAKIMFQQRFPSYFLYRINSEKVALGVLRTLFQFCQSQVRYFYSKQKKQTKFPVLKQGTQNQMGKNNCQGNFSSTENQQESYYVWNQQEKFLNEILQQEQSNKSKTQGKALKQQSLSYFVQNTCELLFTKEEVSILQHAMKQSGVLLESQQSLQSAKEKLRNILHALFFYQ